MSTVDAMRARAMERLKAGRPIRPDRMPPAVLEAAIYYHEAIEAAVAEMSQDELSVFLLADVLPDRLASLNDPWVA